MSWSLIFWEQDLMAIQIFFSEEGWQSKGLAEQFRSYELMGQDLYPPFSPFSLQQRFFFYGKNLEELIPCHPLSHHSHQESWWLLNGVNLYDTLLCGQRLWIQNNALRKKTPHLALFFNRK